jgi:molecular chaperone DnaJ
MTTTPDYYAVLGIDPDATLAQVKKAYRTLARQHHPDTNPGDQQAAARFRQITEAYETLSDPGQRDAYDRACGPVTGTRLATSARTTGPPAS